MLKKGFLIAYLFICAGCFAQQYPFVHYTPKDGLINSRVRKAYQDSKGRMYFLTYGGLSVYDGARFTNYTRQNGLINEVVNDVLETGEDSLLVAVNAPGLNVLVKGHLKKLNLQGNAHPIINHFLKSNGSVFISADEGFYKLTGSSIQQLPVFSSSGKPVIYLGAITGYRDFIVFTTNDLRHNKGLFLYSIKENKITDVLDQLTVHCLRSDHSGLIWVSTAAAATMQNLDTTALAMGKLVLRAPYIASDYQQRLPAGDIYFNRQDQPLIASYHGEIIRFTKNGRALPIASPDQSQQPGQFFFIDREDILWICQQGNGIYKLPNTNLQAMQSLFPENESGVRYLRAFHHHLLAAVMNDRQWILSTPSQTGRFRVSLSSQAIPLQWNKTSLYAIDDSDLYITKLQGTLPQNRSTSNEVLSFKKIMGVHSPSGFNTESIIDPYGNIILSESENILVMKDEKEIFSYPLNFYDLIQGIHIDKNDRLQVVSRSGGLQVFSLHPDDPAHYLKKEAQFIKELNDASPRCMTADKHEILWIGTRHNGLFAFQYTSNQLRQLQHFNTENGLTDNFVTTLACDDSDNLIIGTQTGIDRLVKTKAGSYRLENITRSNNIFTFINYAWTDSLNNAFAITSSGAVYGIQPVQTVRLVPEPKLFIEEMEINGRLMPQSTASLRLQYYQRNIRFSVAAPTFIDEKQVQYSYLLEGSGNKKWSDTSAVADISLLNLSPGKYTLRVKAFFPSTSYAEKETTFSFTILPPWWQTWWFRSVAGLLVIGILVLLTRSYYLRKLEKQKTVLEKKRAIEKERTRIATDMHDDLGAGLSRIKFLSETIGIKKQKQQPIEEDISKIREYSHEMIDKMGEIVWALNEKNDSISDLLSYTRSYAVEYLSQNGITCTVALPDNLPAAFVSGEFRRNIFLAVKEILHNIVKHSRASHVNIVLQTEHDLLITIHDDGIGFDQANTRPYSNGLTNIKKRISDIGGSVAIQVVNGTSITIQVPL